MKIKRNLKPRDIDLEGNQKPGFWQWVIFSPKAYQITLIIAFTAPAALFGLAALAIFYFIGVTFGAVVMGVLWLLSLYNLYKWRWVFKFTPDDNIATAIYGKILGRKEIMKKGEEMLNESSSGDSGQDIE